MTQLGLFNEEKTHYVLSYGMGVDSTAILLRWIEEPETAPCKLEDLIVLTAQVGDEFRFTQDLVEAHVLPRLREHGIRYVQIARQGWPGKDITILDDSRRPERVHIDGSYKLSDELKQAGTVAVKCGRLCSIHAKGEPLDEWMLREFGKGAVVDHTIGFNAEEMNRVERDKSYSKTKLVDTRSRFPLVEWGWGREACKDYIESKTGSRWAKSCCSYCPFSDGRTEHMERLRTEPPELAADAVVMEVAALALNPNMEQFYQTEPIKSRSFRDRCEEVGLEDALELAETMMESGTWRLWRVTRIWSWWEKGKRSGWTSLRQIEMEAEGTREEMRSQLARHGEPEDGLRVRLRPRTKTEGVTEVELGYAITPAFVVPKVNKKFAGMRRKLEERGEWPDN
jgi:hypothetical protein